MLTNEVKKEIIEQYAVHEGDTPDLRKYRSQFSPRESLF